MDHLELVTNNNAFNLPDHSFVAPERSFDGVLSGEMWRRVRDLKSDMPDTFDWSVYDRLYEKFGDDKQPRGGVVFKSPLRLANSHSSCTQCHYTFEIDTYGRGCVHNCSYCYAKAMLSTHGSWNRPHPFPFDLSEIRKIFHSVFETDKDSRWRKVMEQRIPLRIGSMSDSFMKMDKKYGVTKELLKILSHYNYPYIIFTRSDLVAEDEYLKLLRKDLCSVQFSISGNNERLTKIIEPGAPSVHMRMQALKKLNKEGIWTTVRVNPFFPMHPDGYFTNPDRVIERFGSLENAPKFELFDWSMLDQIKEAGVPSLLAGVVRLSIRAVSTMTKETGIDLKNFFDPEQYKRIGVVDVRYSDREIGHYYWKFKTESAKRGIRFNTCYIGMGKPDFFKYQDLWSNKKDCCDAVGNVSKIEKSSQEVDWDERIRLASSKFEAIRGLGYELGTDHPKYKEYAKKYPPCKPGTTTDASP